MRSWDFIKDLARGEDGGFLGTAIVLAIIIAIMAIAIIDGTSVYSTYRAATEVTEEAAARASTEYKLYRNELRAEQAAIDYCEEKGLVFVGAVRDKDLGTNAYTVTCEKDAETYVFKSLPWLKELIHQQGTSTSYRSI